MSLPEHDVRELLSEDVIAGRIRELGEAITRDYPDETEPLLLVGVLKGAVLFLADLIRQIGRPVEYDFVAISSYGSATRSSGEVRLLKDLDAPIADKHILIVEDILDSGLTLSSLVELMSARRAKSIRVCVLLDKPARRQVPVPIAYCGFEIADQFVVGYGLDYAEQYRNLRYVGYVIHRTLED